MANLVNKVWDGCKSLLELALLACLGISGWTGCSGPVQERLSASQNDVAMAWQRLQPLLAKRYEHLPLVITGYEESFGFKNGEYTGDPRVFGWSSWNGEGVAYSDAFRTAIRF